MPRYILILLPDLTFVSTPRFRLRSVLKRRIPMSHRLNVSNTSGFCSQRWKIHQAQMEVEKNSQTSKLEISNISSFIEIRITVNDFPMCTAHESQRQSLHLFLLNVAMTHFPQCTCSMAPLQWEKWSIIQHCQNRKGKWNGFSNE